MANVKVYMQKILKWFLLAVLVGLVTGAVGALFHKAIELATHMRKANDWLIFLLPAGGIAITFLYSLTKDKLTTNAVFECAREKKPVSPFLAPFIFIAAFITHLFGGSAGREGAALQIGGSLSAQIGRAFRLKGDELSTIIICGMSGAFAAIFTTPVTAAIFAVEVINVGRSRYHEILPSVVSAVTGYIVTILMGNEALSFDIISVNIDIMSCLKVAALAVLVAILSIVFCVGLKTGEHYFSKYLKNGYLRSFVGGLIIVGLTFLLGTRDYNGAGMDIIEKAVNGSVKYEAFALKLIFTVITISAGFKGGEIVPAFFVGSTFGAAVSMFLGIDMGFAAAIGMCAMFCGITNCPFASVFLGIELFGGENIIFFALACAVSYVFSGYFGLYSSQQIACSKVAADKIELYTK